MKFSERYGHKPARDTLQTDDVDQELRIALWNVLEIHVWSTAGFGSSGGYGPVYPLSASSNKNLKYLSGAMWVRLFNRPLDELSDDWEKVKEVIRAYNFHEHWSGVYDLIEFIAQNHRWRDNEKQFVRDCNFVLEKESSGYRFVGNQIAPIIDETEISEIDEALGETGGPVRSHLSRALELLSDREKRDYRNSIKESISAVEALVAIEIGSNSGTLGQMLKHLEAKTGLHPALKEAFSKLYGYTSNEDGIRHAILETDTVDFHDAKFMLVTCSAFVNYVRGKE